MQRTDCRIQTYHTQVFNALKYTGCSSTNITSPVFKVYVMAGHYSHAKNFAVDSTYQLKLFRHSYFLLNLSSKPSRRFRHENSLVFSSLHNPDKFSQGQCRYRRHYIDDELMRNNVTYNWGELLNNFVGIMVNENTFFNIFHEYLVVSRIDVQIILRLFDEHPLNQ